MRFTNHRFVALLWGAFGLGACTRTDSGADPSLASRTTALEGDEAAMGFLDHCDETSCSGWARDPDFAAPVSVHFYSPDDSGLFVFRGAVLANQPSEPAVGGTGAHRFRWNHNLPALAFEAPVRAYAIGVDAAGQSSNHNPLLGNADACQIRVPRDGAKELELHACLFDVDRIDPEWIDIPTELDDGDYTTDDPRAYTTFQKNGVTYTLQPGPAWEYAAKGAIAGSIKDGLKAGPGALITGLWTGGIAGYVVGSLFAPDLVAVPRPADIYAQQGLFRYRTSAGNTVYLPRFSR